MILLGLTGSIGMGKSATSEMFREMGVRVYDADASVHALYAEGGAAVPVLEEVFPSVIVDGVVDRMKLRDVVIGNPDELKRLESLVHPLTRAAQIQFLEEAQAAGVPFIVLDVPLLFETGGDARCDYVAVVSASAETQRERVMAREGMTEAVFEDIRSKQVPDADKRAKADFVISTGFGFDFAREQVQAIVNLMVAKATENNTDA